MPVDINASDPVASAHYAAIRLKLRARAGRRARLLLDPRRFPGERLQSATGVIVAVSAPADQLILEVYQPELAPGCLRTTPGSGDACWAVYAISDLLDVELGPRVPAA